MAVGVLLFSASPLYAQVDTGSISGESLIPRAP